MVTLDLVSEQQTSAAPSAARQDSMRTRSNWALLLLTDVLALELCVGLAYLTRLAISDFYPIDLSPAQVWDVAIGVLAVPAAFQIMGFYPGYGLCPVLRLRKRVLGTLAVFGVLIAWAYLMQDEETSRAIMLLSMAYALVLPWLFESILRDALVRSGLWGQGTVVIGQGERLQDITKALKDRPDLGLRPVAVLSDELVAGDGLATGKIAEAAEYARAGVRTAVLALPGLDGAETARRIEDTGFENVIVIPDLFGMQSVWVTPVDLQTVVGLRVRNNLRIRHNYIIKRVFDYIVAVPAALLALPIVGLAALWIKIVDGGPVFFVQRRRGYQNAPIDVMKLRTMYKDADVRLQEHLAANPDAKAEWERFFKLKQDPRVLPGVGHFLRRSSLDELPQIWNVLKGEMTLVGPRPFPDYHLSQFDDAFRELRSTVPPGITGLWQVSCRSNGDLVVQQRLDTYYIRNWSLWLDLHVFMRTILIVIRGDGAC